MPGGHGCMSASPDPTGQYWPGGQSSGVIPLRQKCLEGHVRHLDNPVTLLLKWIEGVILQIGMISQLMI